jgi:imidazole glycerol-phosphate synthase subunit HisH
MNVVIVDYGLGNLTSVSNALGLIGETSIVSNKSEDIARASHLILPGVGAFGDGVRGLRRSGLFELLNKEAVIDKKPILGICLGMQLLMSCGYEGGENAGLNYIEGEVRKIDTTKSKLRLPHIGWNDVTMQGSHALAEGFPKAATFYFVHSYQVIPKDDDVIAGVCDYGESIPAILQKGNICGTQFHPEKSGEDGLQIFKNFLSL